MKIEVLAYSQGRYIVELDGLFVATIKNLEFKGRWYLKEPGELPVEVTAVLHDTNKLHRAITDYLFGKEGE